MSKRTFDARFSKFPFAKNVEIHSKFFLCISCGNLHTRRNADIINGKLFWCLCERCRQYGVRDRERKQRAIPKKLCQYCGKEFLPFVPWQMHCPDCAETHVRAVEARYERECQLRKERKEKRKLKLLDDIKESELYNLHAYMSIDEAAEKLKLAPITVRQYCSDDRLKSINVMNRTFIEKKSVDEYIKNHNLHASVPENYITVKEAIKQFNISKGSLYNYITDGNIDSIKHGRVWWIDKTSLEKHLNNKNIIPDGYLTTNEAAVNLGFCHWHVKNLCRDGKLDAHKSGLRWLIDKQSVENYKRR